MHIWVDADACPLVIKEILYRAAMRRHVPVTFVANQGLAAPSSAYIAVLRVRSGPDVADDAIVERAQSGDLVVTADVPLAARVVEKGAHALNPRGTLYTADNVQERLAVRDLMDQLRGEGVMTGGPPPFKATDKVAFANQLDRFITRGGPE